MDLDISSDPAPDPRLASAGGRRGPRQGQRRLTLRSMPILGALVSVCGLLAAVVSVAFAGLLLSIQELDRASDLRAGSEAIVADANRAEKLLLDLETGVRGFVITNKPTFLEPWRSARTTFPVAAANLDAAVRDNPAQERLAGSIVRSGSAYISGWTVPLIQAERHDQGLARRIIATGRGKRQVDALRRLFTTLIANEQQRSAQRTAQAKQSASRATTFAFAGISGSLLMLVAFALLLGRSVARPLARLGSAADRMAAGDLEARVMPKGPRELARLADSFNAMAQALKHRQAELRAASAKAESASRAKSEFLSRMSHELRTPLNAILGFGQLLELEDLDKGRRDHVEHILKAGRHLLELINEVLELSRIEAGQLSISPESVPLEETVQEALALVRPLAAQQDVTLSADVTGLFADGHVHADRQRLKQVLLNLLSNAIKYNRPGGRVDVSFSRSAGKRIRILVSDTGIGIAQEQLAAVFDPFERLGAELGEVEGTGLGLALSQRLMEAMGGSITLQSNPGQGTTFELELLAARAPGEDYVSTCGQTPAPVSLARLGEKRRRVLYIEDNLSNLTLVDRILERETGVELIPAMQGRLGFELARQHHPELIVLDLHLPDLPGEEVLRGLKTDPATKDIPVVVLSADASKRQIERLLQAGAWEYLTKPLDVKQFLRTVADGLGAELES